MWDNPPHLFNIVHLVELSDERGSCARKQLGSRLGHVLRIGLSQLKPLEFGPRFSAVISPSFLGVRSDEMSNLL